MRAHDCIRLDHYEVAPEDRQLLRQGGVLQDQIPAVAAQPPEREEEEEEVEPHDRSPRSAGSASGGAQATRMEFWIRTGG